MENSRTLLISLVNTVSAALILSVLAGCKAPTATPTVQRGFNEPSRFAGMLEPNPQTVTAKERSSPVLSTVELQRKPIEITRYSKRTFPLTLTKQPVWGHLKASVWHQGTGRKPLVSVNGKRAGTLEPCWPSLSHRNYVFFLFDGSDGKSILYAVDYQGWLTASCFIKGDLLKAGDNTISIAVTLDQIKIKDMLLELLYGMDSADTIHDFRKVTRDLPLPMVDKR